MLVQGQIAATAKINYSYGQNAYLLQGRQGDLLVSNQHGKWYTPAYGGIVYSAATAAAGITIPVNAANLVSVFSLLNPQGSGVNAELIDLDIFMVNATEVVSGVALVYQSGIGAGVTTPGTITKGAVAQQPLQASAGGNQVAYCSALTHVGTPTILRWIAGFQATAGGALQPHTEFDGKILLPPGSVLSIAGSAAQTQAAVVSMSWAEYPV